MPRSTFALALLLGSLFACLTGSAALAAIDTTAEHALLMDGESGDVIWAKDGYVAMPPASMSKLMTLELLFQRLKEGRLKLTDKLSVSQRAWQTQGSKSFVSLGSQIAIQDLIRGIIIQSGNDACIVVAEGIGGTVEGFVATMNARAKQLGLAQSHFVNPDGLPDPPGQLMSALDLAKLARHIVQDYPAYYHFFGEREFVWNNIRQPNRNTVLEKLQGADGLKTGHTDAAGYGVTASASRNGQRLILVLNGLRYPDLMNASPQKQDWFAEQRRGDEAARILNIGFSEFHRYALFGNGDVVATAEVWHGTTGTVPLTLGVPLATTLEPDARDSLKVSVKYDGPVQAPIVKGQQIGTLTVTANGHPPRDMPLYAAEAVPEASFFRRAFQGLDTMLGKR